MANRQQRRMAAKKRPGENYADVLMKQKLIRETVQQEVHSESVKLEADIKTQRFMWMAVVALNETSVSAAREPSGSCWLWKTWPTNARIWRKNTAVSTPGISS